MATRRVRKSPENDAKEYIMKAVDKTDKLEVKYISSFKGRGVVEYRGELNNFEESQRRRQQRNRADSLVFLFDFSWQEKIWCVDAAREDGSLGRLINDDHKNSNCKMKKVMA
ncbi:hypothetical protein LDENG_00217720 [Lucifuga dentata]|nr:hypothetical protein LDENG_00217720 [Lucifuga dentata]